MIAEQPVDEILAAYLKAVEAGEAPDRQDLVDRHPEVADELREFFAGLDQFEELAAPLRAVRSSAADASRPGVETVNDSKQTGPYAPPAPGRERSEGLSSSGFRALFQPSQLTDRASRDRPDGGTALAIPGYEILGELGRGGMGVVHKARQIQLKRLVALKMIRAGDHADEAELARFLVEAEAVARLQHPNIVQIYEVGEHAGRPFISLEFVGGGTLSARLAGTPQPPRDAASVARTLALAMGAAHQCGIVHRDLKPANVLLTEDGSPKITDFGLAKRLDEDTAQTRTGAIMGTPAYMSPEQALGQKEVGPLTDVYALGAILYEMLTGRPPFKAATVLETLDQVRTQEPVPVRLLQPKVPRDLETICLKCLGKEPNKRYASAEALARDLERWSKGEPIKARRSRVWERGYRWVCRNPLPSVLVTLTLVAILGGFVGVSWQLSLTQAALDEAKTNLYHHRITLADREVQAGNGDRAEVLLDLCPEPLRHWEWYYLKRRCHGRWLQLTGHTDLVRCVVYSDDGKRVASCANDGTVRVWDATTGGQEFSAPHGGWVNAVVFHADGRAVVSAGEDGTIKLWDAGGRELDSYSHGLARVTLSPAGRHYALLSGEGLTVYELGSEKPVTAIPGRIPTHWGVALTPDGSRVATALDASLGIWDARTGKELKALIKYKYEPRVHSLALSPDGGRLFVGLNVDNYPVMKVWDVETGKELSNPLSTPLTVTAIALTHQGDKIATGGLEGTVKIRDTETGKDLHTTPRFADSVKSLAFRPDGEGLAVAEGRNVWVRAWGGQQDRGPLSVTKLSGRVTSVAFSPDGSLAWCGETDRVHIAAGPTGETRIALAGHAEGYSGLAFSPQDGRRVLARGADGTVYTWDSTTGEAGPHLRVLNADVTEAVYSPDGRRIATASGDRVVRLWDADTGKEVLSYRGHEAGVLSVTFNRDGSRLASAAGDGSVRVWDSSTAQEILTLRGHESYVQSVAFHPNGKILASASTDETVRLWDLVTGKVSVLQGHTGPVRGLSFSPDGRRLASASEDGTARLWDTTTGLETLSLPDPANGKVHGVAFAPDGNRLATASSKGNVTIWDATPLEK